MKKTLALFALFALFASPASIQTLADARRAYGQKEYEKAFAMLESLAQSDGRNSEVHLLLGHVSSKLGKWDKAIQSFEETTRLDPESVAAYLQLGFLYEKRKDNVKAAEAWAKVLSLAKNEKTRELAQKHLNNLK
ncbi:MAG: tetratricopeptide repeat protein [Elusimicrobia bacterium]|nr:tetratricopeptide repeat protein [Elusimicrobiota bacterium]